MIAIGKSRRVERIAIRGGRNCRADVRAINFKLNIRDSHIVTGSCRDRDCPRERRVGSGRSNRYGRRCGIRRSSEGHIPAARGLPAGVGRINAKVVGGGVGEAGQGDLMAGHHRGINWRARSVRRRRPVINGRIGGYVGGPIDLKTADRGSTRLNVSNIYWRIGSCVVGGYQSGATATRQNRAHHN